MDEHGQQHTPVEPEVIIPRSVELIDPRLPSTRPTHRVMGRSRVRIRPKLAAGLFLATCLSTFFVGGPIYCVAVMAILIAHEMGHYIQARRYGVPASLPYFIPMPLPPLGTLGAVIVQGAELVETDDPLSADNEKKRTYVRVSADRKQMFDIAITGPLAGLIVALPIVWLGVWYGKVEPLPENFAGLRLGDPLILQWITAAIHGPVGPNEDLMIGPLGMAGWVGILITALNLIPIGQLDGGHIMYALIGKRSHYVAIALIGVAIAFMVITKYPAYSLMLVLLIITGPKHPPTANDDIPLGRFRIILGWLTLAFIIIGFTPMPFVDV